MIPGAEAAGGWLAAGMVALDAAWLAVAWRLGGPRLRIAATLAAGLTAGWALVATGQVAAPVPRSAAVDLTGLLWHAAIVPLALLVAGASAAVRRARGAGPRRGRPAGDRNGAAHHRRSASDPRARRGTPADDRAGR